MKNTIKNIIVLLVVTFIMIVLAEVMLSALDIPKYSTFPESYRRVDPVRHHAFIPNTYGRMSNQDYTIDYFINSLGLRDNEISIKKDKYRILMLGDSFTEGMGVNINQTIAKQLESLFKENGYDVEVINGGIASYSPSLEYLYLKNEGIKLDPDLVILNLDLSDTNDDFEYEKFATFDDDGELVSIEGTKVQPATSLKGKIDLFCMKHELNLCILGGRTVLKVMSYYEKPPKEFSEKYFNNTEPTLLNRSLTYIKKTDNLCESEGVSFVLVTYPHAPQVNENEWKEGRKRMSEASFSQYSLEFFDKVGEFAEDNNISYIDTYYKFKDTEEYPLYYDVDPHMTEKGYGLVARGIFEKLMLNEEIMKDIEKDGI